jgi:DNA helicase-2/ATP-dependent DNA helicase PcrA
MSDIKTTPAFKQAYQQLNPAQKQAVDQIEGPVMVVAGPGTGKTQVLTARIANILLKTDTDPSAILALTFTDSAAKTMRERLSEMIGKTAYYVNITTFHSFCVQILRQHPEYFPIERDSQPLSDLERYELFEELIVQTNLEKIKPLNAPYHYLPDIVKAISDLKREGVSPTDFADIIRAEEKALQQERDDLNKTDLRKRERDLTKWHDLLKLYQAYQTQLREKQRYDFDDMIALVVEAFKNEELLLREYQEKLHYFLVDEYQDTNSAQNQVVDLLASYWGEQANVFTVGDPNQAIYRFQGASIENMLGFVDRYPTSTVINLNLGYRCPQSIYDAAHSLIQHNQLSQTKINHDLNNGQGRQQAKRQLLEILNQPLKTAYSEGEPVKVFAAPVQTLETVFVARQIQDLIEQGTDPEQIAVLYRYNSDAGLMSQALEKWGIRYEIDGGNNILKSEFIDQILSFFQVLLDLRTSSEDELVFKIMHYPWFELDELQIMKLARIAGKLKLSLLDVIDHGYEFLKQNEFDQLLEQKKFEQIAKFVKDLYHWSSLDASNTFSHWFEIVISESNLLAWIKGRTNKIELLNELNSLYNQIKSMVAADHQFKLKDFLNTIEVMQEHNLKINAEDLNIKQQAVHLATVHKAKGQEWEHVFLLHCVDRKWGNHFNRELLPLPKGLLSNTDVSKKERNEDERRVFYVALTRASQQVTITYPETVVQDNRTSEKVPSQFLLELGKTQTLEDDGLLDKADDYLVRLMQPPPERVSSNQEKKFFENLVKDFKLSVTALNNYLRDPQEFIENNLLRVPRAKPLPMAFGTAVHQALERLYQCYLDTGKRLPEKELLTEFEKALAKEVLTEVEFEERLRRGREILANYYQQTQDDEPNVVEVERLVGYGWSKAVLDNDIELTGKLDRIDWLDRSKKLVRVVDYKTGKPKTKGYIEGTVKAVPLSEREQNLPETIRGPYKRQLVFYKLLTELDRSFNATVTEGVFDFVEPYDPRTGRLMPRVFKISKEEVEDLKNLIREVMKEIRGLEFLKIV